VIAGLLAHWPPAALFDASVVHQCEIACGCSLKRHVRMLAPPSSTYGRARWEVGSPPRTRAWMRWRRRRGWSGRNVDPQCTASGNSITSAVRDFRQPSVGTPLSLRYCESAYLPGELVVRITPTKVVKAFNIAH
jgi:hypothetical protein